MSQRHDSTNRCTILWCIPEYGALVSKIDAVGSTKELTLLCLLLSSQRVAVPNFTYLGKIMISAGGTIDTQLSSRIQKTLSASYKLSSVKYTRIVVTSELQQS